MRQTFQELTWVTTQIHENILSAFNFSPAYVQYNLLVGINYKEGKVWAMLCKYKIYMSLCILGIGFSKRRIQSWFIINLPLKSQESLLWAYSTSFSSSLQLWDKRKRSSSISSLYNGSLSCKSLKLSLKPECRVSMTYR